MRVLIKKVVPRMKTQEGEQISSFNILGQFISGIEVKILDDIPFDLRQLENQEIECLLIANLFKIPKTAELKPNFPQMEGIYLGDYNIPNRWEIGSLYQLDQDWHDYTYHAIKTEDGLFTVKSNNLNHYDVKVGEKFKFKAIDFDLMAWEPIKGKKEIDPLTFEKKMIDKFWDLIESTHKIANNQGEDQLDLLKKELLNWDLNEIWLFDDILIHLSTALRFKHSYFQEKMEASINDWTDFYQGIVVLGRKIYNRALNRPKLFFQDILDRKHSENPKDIEIYTASLTQDVVEQKTGKSIEYVADFMLRKDIEEVRDRIGILLDQEFNIDWDKPTS